MNKLRLRRPKRRKEPDHGDKSSYSRNRVLTGHGAKKSDRQVSHNQRAQRRRLGVISLLLALALALVGFVLSQYSRSATLGPVGGSAIVRELDDDGYGESFADYYGDHPLQRFRFLMRYDNLLASLQGSHPEIQAIKPAGTAGFGVAHYLVNMRQPVASWKVGGELYFVDSTGVIFQRNYYSPPAVSVVDNSGARSGAGAVVASERTLAFIGQAVSLAADKNIKVRKIEIPPGALRVIYLETKGKLQVHMTVDRAVGYQVDGLAKAQAEVKRKSIKPRYIDVRVPGKIFYR